MNKHVHVLCKNVSNGEISYSNLYYLTIDSTSTFGLCKLGCLKSVNNF